MVRGYNIQTRPCRHDARVDGWVDGWGGGVRLDGRVH